MRKNLKIVCFVVLIILIPMLLDIFIFGNTFPSNIENQTWAGFLGSYLGGIATLVAVFITISDNNKKIEEQKRTEKEQLIEQKNMQLDLILRLDIFSLMIIQRLD